MSEEKHTKKVKNLILYMASIGLAVFYIVALYLACNPQVGIEYKMYYITNELTDWPGYGKLAYEYGTMEHCTGYWDADGNYLNYRVCRRKGKGWKKYQNEGSVNSESTSYMYYIPTASKEKAEFFVDILSFSGDEPVQVYANDVQIGSFSEKGECNFAIDRIKKDELLTIRFESGDGSFCLWKAAIR